ncbi:MAG: restriction endonuclease subunit S [Gammaproteobacteria bacterium]|nr:restriction endonuclease subunit S [Gammaproteobacteria bacterium]
MTFPFVELGEVAKLDRQSLSADQIKEGAQYLGLEHIESGGEILGSVEVEAGELKSSKFQFSDEHVLYGKLRPYLAKIALPSFSGICSTDIIPIRPGSKLDRRYLAYFLRSEKMVDYANSRASGANLPRLSPKQLAKLPVPLPPLPEQKRIAKILDAADALRAKRRESLAQLDALLQSTFLEMFGDPVENLKGWATSRIDSLSRLVRGSSPRPKGDPAYYGGEVPRLMVGDITRDGFWVTPRIDSLTFEGAKKSRPVPRGTVVMAVSGDVGVVSQTQVDCCVHDGFVAFLDIDRERIESVFIKFQLHLLKLTHERRKAGAIFQNLTTKDIKSMVIMCPPLNLQRKFVEFVDALESHQQLLKTHLDEHEALFASLQQCAFAGQL